VNSRQFKLVTAGIGASAAIAISVLGVAFSTVSSAEPVMTGPVPTSEATKGETMTIKTPPPTPSVNKAKPQITGPAPLPPEEQGLPG
jgi:hypothetical protein